MAKPRFTIRWLMIIIAVTAGCLFLQRQFGTAMGLAFAIWLTTGYLGGDMARCYPRWGLRGIVLSSTLLSGPVAWFQVYHLGESFIDPTYVLLFLTAPAFLGSVVGWTIANVRRGSGRRLPGRQMLILGMGLLPWTMVLFHWPLYLAFFWSERALNRLADQVAAGEFVSWPAQAGVYQIHEAKQDPEDNNSVVLYVTEKPKIWIEEPNIRVQLVRLKVVGFMDTYTLSWGGSHYYRLSGPWRYRAAASH